MKKSSAKNSKPKLKSRTRVPAQPQPRLPELSSDDLLIALLKNSAGAYISGEEIARTLDVSRSAVWKKIKELEEVGYGIEAVPHLGYRLTGLPSRLVPEEIRFGLSTRALGQRVFVFPSTDSTNRVALDMGRKGAPHGQAILAETQTNGRGRLGRAWTSPAGKGIYLSVILRPKLDLSQVSKLTLAAAVAAAETLEAAGIKGVQIKWPNDLLIKGRKVCGILTEMVAEADRVECVILGIGINVNTPQADLPPHATSLRIETGRDTALDRNALVASLLNRLEPRLEQVTGKAWDATRSAWNRRSSVKGKKVKVTTLSQSDAVTGIAQALDPSGALLIKTPSGLKKIVSGDVLSCR
jgi:BirA family biotin operon repressor/biotin-[acetyl-CoA-carboxylase] ligase